MTKNYYQVLGVSKSASQATIKAAFKKLAIKFHPDKNPGSEWAEVRFKEINSAYQTLSDPHKRAMYDLQMEYRANPVSYSRPQPAAQPYYRADNRNYKHSRFSKEALARNKWANRWALGIVGSLFALVIIFNAVISIMEHFREAELMEQDQVVLNDARQKFSAGIFPEAFGLLDDYMIENGNRESIVEQREVFLQEMMVKGDDAYFIQDYPEALKYYKVIFQYDNNLSLDYYKKVATSSREIGNYADAASAYAYIADKMPENLESRIQAGLIYTYNLKEYENALTYYKEARELTIKKYVDTYGKAFVLVFNPEDIPETHYMLYCGLGLSEFRLGNYQEAIDALDWALILRPKRPEAFYISGLLFHETGKVDEACDAWKSAYLLGLEEAGRLARLNCSFE